MKKHIIIATSLVTLALAAPVLASSDDRDSKYYGSGKVEWMSPNDAKAKAMELGYKVRRIKRDDGYYEVYAFDKEGRAVELYLHPTTGKIVKSELKF